MIWSSISTVSSNLVLCRFPRILQQPHAVFEEAHFSGFNEFISLVCWCTVIRLHRPQGLSHFLKSEIKEEEDEEEEEKQE